MQEPKQRAWDGVVVPRVAHVEESEDVLIEEIEPEEAVVDSWLAAHGEVEVGRILQRGQHVPGSGDDKNDERPREEVQPLPVRFRSNCRVRRIDPPAAKGKSAAIKPLSSSPRNAGRQQEGHNRGRGSSSSSARNRLHMARPS